MQPRVSGSAFNSLIVNFAVKRYAPTAVKTVTLNFLEACDDRVLERKPFLLVEPNRALPWVSLPSDRRITLYAFCPKLRPASTDNCH
jgi:hypothetical protein